MRYSSNDFAKAMDSYTSLTEQNRLMETVSVDFADIINQIAEFKATKTAMVLPKLRTAVDVQYVVAQAAAQLRVLLAEFGGADVGFLNAEIDDLNEEIEDLQAQIEELKAEKA